MVIDRRLANPGALLDELAGILGIMFTIGLKSVDRQEWLNSSIAL